MRSQVKQGLVQQFHVSFDEPKCSLRNRYTGWFAIGVIFESESLETRGDTALSRNASDVANVLNCSAIIVAGSTGATNSCLIRGHLV